MTILSTSIRNAYNRFEMPQLLPESEITKISQYIRSRFICGSCYLRPLHTGLARAIQFTRDGHVFVHLNKHDDPILGEGQVKKIKIAVDVDTGELFASASASKKCPGEEIPLDREVTMLRKVKGLEGWMQIHGDVVYNHDKLVKRRMLLELCNGGNLFSAIEKDRGCELVHGRKSPVESIRITPEEKKLIFEKLVIALESFHAMGLVHGDIKPDNILLIRDEDGKIIDIRISDLGGSCHSGERKFMAVTLAYCSPEYFPFVQSILQKSPQLPPQITPAHDMWCLGATLFNLFDMGSGSLPFTDLYGDETKSVKLLQEIQVVREIYFAMPKGPIKPQYVATRLIRPDPDRRLTAQEIREEWMPRINWVTEPVSFGQTNPL